MPDDLPPIVTDIQDAPPRRGRRLTVMPQIADMSKPERRALVDFMRGRLEEIERDYQERLELIQSGKEHPIPVYAKLVHNHAAMGLPKKHIAQLLGISVAVMERYYSDDMELGIAQINLRIASNVARKALSDDPDAAKVGLDWLDRMGGERWRKSQKIEVQTEERVPNLDLSKTTYEERQALRAILMRAATRAAEGEEGEALHADEIDGE